MRQPLLKEKALMKSKIQFNKSPTFSNTAVKKARVYAHTPLQTCHFPFRKYTFLPGFKFVFVYCYTPNINLLACSA